MAGDFLNLLGIAKKANMLELGEEACAAAARAHHVRAVLTASDTAQNALAKANSIAALCNAPHISVSATKAELGNALGKRPCAIIGVCDMGIAAALVKKLAPENEQAAAVAEDMQKNARRIQARRIKKKYK